MPAEPGGDYVTPDGNGLSDCDAHGTLVASLMAGRPNPDDAFVGVAPDARIVSIRHTSEAFSPTGIQPDPNDPNQSRPAGSVRTLARAIVHAANMGAKVINISLTACIKATVFERGPLRIVGHDQYLHRLPTRSGLGYPSL